MMIVDVQRKAPLIKLGRDGRRGRVLMKGIGNV